MDIQVFGSVTEKTTVLARQCQLAAAANGSRIAIHIASRCRIAEMGIGELPAIAVNGIILSSGRIPARQEIEAWINETDTIPPHDKTARFPTTS